jgi:hypothetical protein
MFNIPIASQVARGKPSAGRPFGPHGAQHNVSPPAAPNASIIRALNHVPGVERYENEPIRLRAGAGNRTQGEPFSGDEGRRDVVVGLPQPRRAYDCQGPIIEGRSGDRHGPGNARECESRRASKSLRGTMRGVRSNIELMHSIAASRGGKCLSKSYINARTRLFWECALGHVWEAKPDSVKRGSWCRKCGYGRGANKLRGSIEACRRVAKGREGHCVSLAYVNSGTKLRWCCKYGHEWAATPGHIFGGGWCPTCHGGAKEKSVRNVLERLLNTKFPKVRPAWLTNPETGGGLELDGYSEERGVAFEYQGERHFNEHHLFKNFSDDGLARRDQIKRKICGQRGIILLEVPSGIAIPELPPFILRLCRNAGLSCHEGLAVFDVGSFAYGNGVMLAQAEAKAKTKGGRCLSKEYVDSKFKLHWQCAKGHDWWARLGNVRNGKWCPECSGHRRVTVARMRETALERGGECLSHAYMGNTVKHHWRCAAGHDWWAVYQSIKSGCWCPLCSRKKGIETRLANKKGRGR